MQTHDHNPVLAIALDLSEVRGHLEAQASAAGSAATETLDASIQHHAIDVTLDILHDRPRINLLKSKRPTRLEFSVGKFATHLVEATYRAVLRHLRAVVAAELADLNNFEKAAACMKSAMTFRARMDELARLSGELNNALLARYMREVSDDLAARWEASPRNPRNQAAPRLARFSDRNRAMGVFA